MTQRGGPALAAAIDAAHADTIAFVHVGGAADADLRYLTGFDVSGGECAFVHVADRSLVCVPKTHLRRAEQSFDGEVRALDAPAGHAAATVLDAMDAPDTVLVPRHIPHDAATYLERAGYTLSSTSAVADARAVKSPSERDRIRTVQAGAAHAMARVAALLSSADAVGDELRLDGEPLTTARLRREANTALADRGLSGVENTVVRAATDVSDVVRPGDPVWTSLAPRGSMGYHGALARTFVAESEGGWERRAAVAVDAARRAGLEMLEAGVSAHRVREEIVVELGAYGLSPAPAVPEAPGVGWGVGLSAREAPSFDADDGLSAGSVLAVAPAVADAEYGRVGTVDLVSVTESGYERIESFPTSLSPTAPEQS